MVGIVIVSHSENLAKSVIELISVMVPDGKIAAAGGTEDGKIGTSFNKIQSAIESVYSDDGVIVLMDLGSAVMTTEMVIEMMEGKKVVMADCPLVEGAVVASIEAFSGVPLEKILEKLETVGTTKKISKI
ncbi:dihydroxyacetone kinase phosphoryl donor subunit DhaM [Lachnospiraceae bacterium 62-35]